MEFTEAVRQRRMVRAFSTRPLEAAVLDAIVELAARAPSAGGTEAVDLLVLTSAASRASFWTHASSPRWRATAEQARGITAAPALVLVLAEPDAYTRRYAAPDKALSPLGGRDARDWPVPYWAVDAAFHALLVLLGAVDKELGALFFFVRGDHGAMLDEFGVPNGRALVGAVALGYRADTAPTATRPTRRRRREEVVHRERW